MQEIDTIVLLLQWFILEYNQYCIYNYITDILFITLPFIEYIKNNIFKFKVLFIAISFIIFIFVGIILIKLLSKRVMKKHLYSTYILITIQLLLLTGTCHTAQADTLQTNILTQAQRMIERNGPRGEEVCNTIDSIIKLNFIADSTFASVVVKDIGNYFRQQGEQSNAIEIFSQAASYLEKRECPPALLLRIYLPLGAAFEEVGLWSSGMEYYHRALRIAQDNNLQADIARIYNNIGAAYYRSDIDKAEEYIMKSLDINKRLGEKNELYLNYSNLAGICIQQNKLDAALDYALMALQIIDREKDRNLYYSMQRNIGTLYMSRNETTLATSYFLNAKEYFEEIGSSAELAYTYTLLIDVYKSTGNIHEATKYVHLIEKEIIPNLTNREIESKTHTVLSEFYQQNGNYKRAYEHLYNASLLKDSLTIANDARKVNNLERIYDNEQKLRENNRIINEMHINKLKTDRSITFIIIALIAMVIIIIFLIVRSELQRKLHKTTTQLAEQQIELQEKEKELQQIKETELNRTIDKKNRELSSYALSYTKDNEFMVHLSEELKQLLLEINPRDKEHKEHIRSILAQLKQHCAPDNWQEFKYYFEQVHPSFYDHLDELSPGITQRQKRLCAMLYIGLTTKEISSITFREVRSIESARNRLRKKLEVPSDQTIQDFLSRKLNSEKDTSTS